MAEEVRHIVECCLGGGRLLNDGKNYQTNCPKCGGDRFYVDVNGRGKCHKGKCQWKCGGIKSLRRAAADKPLFIGKLMDTSNFTNPIAGAKWAASSDGMPQEAFLKGRGIENPHHRFGMSFSLDGKYIRFPCWNVITGKVVGYTRNTDPKNKGQRWSMPPGVQRNHMIFANETTREDSERVFLTEGIFDLGTPGMVDCGVAILGAHLSDEVTAFLTRYDEVLLFFDNDEAGRTAALSAASVCAYWGIPYTDYGARFYKAYPEIEDPGDVWKYPNAQKNLMSTIRKVMK